MSELWVRVSAFRRTDTSMVFMSFSVCAAFSASTDRFEVRGVHVETLVLWVCFLSEWGYCGLDENVGCRFPFLMVRFVCVEVIRDGLEPPSRF